jgi:DNA processing protein
MQENATPYWMAFAHAKGFVTSRKMDFIIAVVHEGGVGFVKAMHSIRNGDRCGFEFSAKEWEGLINELSELQNYSFLLEEIESAGISCINILDKLVYPKSLKHNLKKNAPIVIYFKGNLQMLQSKSIAIVGARKCGKLSLDFTDTIARSAVGSNKVVVSGGAKGVDLRALEATLSNGGKTIMVLPQGLLTYKSKTYYKSIVSGDLLILSTYHPKAGWSTGLAMARNKTVYALSDQIFVAESSSKGGTWEGVNTGLKDGRPIYVRVPSHEEKNANHQLIELGAVSISQTGQLIKKPDFVSSENKESVLTPTEKVIKILNDLNGKGITKSEIIKELSLNESQFRSLAKSLKESPYIVLTKKGKQSFYHLKSSADTQEELF